MLPVRRKCSLGKPRNPQQTDRKLKGRPLSRKASRPKTQASPGEPVDWQSILDDVNFIRGKLDETEQSKLDQQPNALMEQLLYHTEFLYGQPQSIEAVQTLYRQVLELHRANSLLREHVSSVTK